MATRISTEKIIEINEAYLKIGSYAGTARAVGVSPSTVKKYIKKDYVPANEVKRIQIDTVAMKERLENYNISKEELEKPYLLMLTDEEKEEIKEFWKELII